MALKCCQIFISCSSDQFNVLWFNGARSGLYIAHMTTIKVCHSYYGLKQWGYCGTYECVLLGINIV